MEPPSGEAIHHGLRCLQLRLVTCAFQWKIYPPVFFGPAKTAFKLPGKWRNGYKTTSIYFFLYNPHIFFASIAFSDNKEGDVLLKMTKFTSSNSWDNWQDAISSTGCKVAAKQEMTPMIRNEAASRRNWGSFPQSLQNGLFSSSLNWRSTSIWTSWFKHLGKHNRSKINIM